MADYIETPTIGEILNEEFLIPLGLSDGYFLSLQDDIDIRNAKLKLAPQLEEIKTYVFA